MVKKHVQGLLQMGESKDTRALCEQLTKCNAYVVSLVASTRQQAGLPDRYVHHAQWCGWLEFKGPNTPTTLNQTLTLEHFNKRRPNTAFIVRLPNTIETPRNVFICTFDGTAQGLLDTLERLSNASLDTID